MTGPVALRHRCDASDRRLQRLTDCGTLSAWSARQLKDVSLQYCSVRKAGELKVSRVAQVRE